MRSAWVRLLAVCLVLAGCSTATISATEAGIGGRPTSILMRYTTLQPEAKTPRPTPARAQTSLPVETSLPEVVIFPSSTSLPPEPSVTPLPVVDGLCSPLELVDLKDLPRIISDGYHPPPKGSDARHQGVDFCYYHWKGQGPIDGTLIKSVLPGVVAISQKDTYPLGNVVAIETPRERLPQAVRQEFKIEAGDSLYVLYAHMKEGSPFVALGEEVTACEPIGLVGRTGNTMASHLHFETRVGPAGLRLDGFSLYVDTASEQEKKNYRLWSIGGQYNTFDPMRLLLFPFAQTP
jgi:murein DD-endopeptidase MepM/ murein hydrolase activator NlpD